MTYSNVTTVLLTDNDINLGGTDSAGCNPVVTNGTTTTATVTVTGCTGDGTMNISLDANTAQNSVGDQVGAYGPSSSATIKNTFIAVFDTRNTAGGSSASTDIAIPLVDWIGYDFYITWGDGTAAQHVTGSGQNRVITHSYSTAGIYEVKMKGVNLPWLQFCSGTDKLKITDVKQWGLNAWWRMQYMFAHCENVQISATDAPNLASLDSSGFRAMFQGAIAFNSNINHWTTTNVKAMDQMFVDATTYNKPLSNWDTSNVTTMGGMFAGATAFNQNISTWNTANVTNMDYMFFGASVYNSPMNKSGSAWDTSKVTSMDAMFQSAYAFNQNISGWVFSSGLTSMDQIFLNALAFNQNLSSWALPTGVSHYQFDVGANSWVLAKPTFP